MEAALWFIGLALITLAGLLHLVFFLLETMLWDRLGRRTFGVRAEDSDAVRVWALNQGWYNLFLGVGAIAASIAGLFWWNSILAVIAAPIAAFTAFCMLGAAVVLVASNPRMLRGALIQGLAPLLGLVALGLATFG